MLVALDQFQGGGELTPLTVVIRRRGVDEDVMRVMIERVKRGEREEER